MDPLLQLNKLSDSEELAGRFKLLSLEIIRSLSVDVDNVENALAVNLYLDVEGALLRVTFYP